MSFMKIEFLKADSLDVVFTKDSDELKSVINVISRVGTEVNLNFSENDFIHGYVSNVIYNVDAVNNEESLQICIIVKIITSHILICSYFVNILHIFYRRYSSFCRNQQYRLFPHIYYYCISYLLLLQAMQTRLFIAYKCLFFSDNRYGMRL